MKKNTFTFLEPDKLIDNELELILVKKVAAKPEKGFFPCYEFDMRNTEAGERMGGIDLRIGNNENTKYGGHFGYNVLGQYRGRRLAARSLKLLFPLAKKHGLNPVWVTCDPENTASRKICELAGGELVEIVELPKHNDQYKRGERQKCSYRFDI